MVEENKEMDIAIEEIDEKEEEKLLKEEASSIERDVWQPRTSLGKKVKSGEITNIDQILDSGLNIMESEIIDFLLPNISTELLFVGQSKGKFGGGQKRVFKQTQKKTSEGNKPRFSAVAISGDKNGHIGIGYGKSKETVPAREKAIRNSKINIIKIRRGCGSWACGCKEPHSIPFKVSGRCGSCRIELFPAPKGTGLCVEEECKKLLSLAGIKDVWSKTKGQSRTKLNLLIACFNALRSLMEFKLQKKYFEPLGVVEGGITTVTEKPGLEAQDEQS